MSCSSPTRRVIAETMNPSWRRTALGTTSIMGEASTQSEPASVRISSMLPASKAGYKHKNQPSPEPGAHKLSQRCFEKWEHVGLKNCKRQRQDSYREEN